MWAFLACSAGLAAIYFFVIAGTAASVYWNVCVAAMVPSGLLPCRNWIAIVPRGR